MAKKSSERSAAASQRRRRSADPRRNDPERTRRSILAAAKEEFGRYGFKDARVTRIAQAAGVGHQLITYHFGSKQGLFEALQDQWIDRHFVVESASDSLVASVREYVHWAHEDESWARALTRQALEGSFPISDERVARLIELMEKTRLRQKRGDVREDIDVGAVSLAFFAASIAPAIFPAFARAFIGVDPSSAHFAELYAEQLSRMVAALAQTEPKPASDPGEARPSATAPEPSQPDSSV
ncbi:TetR/AcrR family transcriptional regulator [Streptomyces sp. NPDC004629]|uniref:TetR/AcrR family transcriptional regulator n=1 Tax=Streptomyces sp. NPDC004629 TaxID=3364705 RepID=UPI00369BE04B